MAMTTSHETASPTVTAIGAAAILAVPVVLAGCGAGGGGGGGDASPGPAILITSIAISVAADDPAAAIQVDTVPVDGSGTAAFGLDGGSRATSRPRDPVDPAVEGAYEFAIAASSPAGTANATVAVTINPPADQALPAGDERVLRTRHLFARAGFGASEADLLTWLNVPYATVVERTVSLPGYAFTEQDQPDAATFRVLTWQEVSRLSTSEQQAHNDAKGRSLTRLYEWWWREMVRTRQPLLERMALFWSGLLVVSGSDIFEPQPVWGYLDVLRRNALGSFRDLIHAIARDPAMVRFLNSDSNVKGRPNENFARELMELFTLGEGHVYTEQDVVEVAKCFTGWGITDRSAFMYYQDRHEPGAKTVFGQTISFPDDDPEQVRKDGEAVIDLILAQDRVAVHVCERLWDEFIGGTRDDGTIAGWADIFRGAERDYDIRRVLQAVFLDPAFTDAAARGAMLRSPVELHVAIHRGLGVEPEAYDGVYWQASEEEQALLAPPNVRGWVGGMSWISSRSLLVRRTHMQWLGWELYNDNRQKVPERLDPVIETILFATPAVNRAAIDAAAAEAPWDPRGERIRRQLVDPALNCK